MRVIVCVETLLECFCLCNRYILLVYVFVSFDHYRGCCERKKGNGWKVGLDDAQITSEFERIARAFPADAAASSPTLPLIAFVVQDHQGSSNLAPADDAPLHSIPIPKAESGLQPEPDNNVVEPRIHDCISNLSFSISPTTFSQVNTFAVERLYSLAGAWSGLGPDTLLFGVCCGTGTIGLTLAHRIGMLGQENNLNKSFVMIIRHMSMCDARDFILTFAPYYFKPYNFMRFL